MSKEDHRNQLSNKNSEENQYTKNSFMKLKDLSPFQGIAQKLKRNYKSKLWNEKNTELFYRLNAVFSGSIDMIYNYFKKHVSSNITLKKIKYKFKKELKYNAEKLFDKAIKPKLKEKLQKKLEQVAKMHSLDLVVRWSQVSDIDNNQIQGENQQDTEIQQHVFDEINCMLKENRIRQTQQIFQQQDI